MKVGTALLLSLAGGTSNCYENEIATALQRMTVVVMCTLRKE